MPPPFLSVHRPRGNLASMVVSQESVSEFEPKHPQLDPRYHPTDSQSLQNAKPQTIDAKVELGINLVATNIFGVVTQSVSQFNPIPAPGAFETVIVNTMQPQTQNKDIKMQSSVGSPTVVIS